MNALGIDHDVDGKHTIPMGVTFERNSVLADFLAGSKFASCGTVSFTNVLAIDVNTLDLCIVVDDG